MVNPTALRSKDAGYAFLETYHVVRKRVDRALAQHSSSVSRVKLLTLLHADGPSRMSTLASQLDIALRSVMDAVASLERDGMVKRRKDPKDGRAVLASITPAGRTSLRASLRVREKVMSQIFGALTAVETVQLLDMLKKLQTGLAER